MSPNVGTLDRISRAGLGVLLLYLAFGSGLTLFDAGLFKYAAVIIGIVMLATSAFRFCPLYRLFGMCTCKQG